MGVIFAAKVISAVFVAALAASSAVAHDFKVGALDISHPWSRPTVNGVTVAGGYLTNTGETPNRCIRTIRDRADQAQNEHCR